MRVFHRRKGLVALFFIAPLLLLGAASAGAQTETPNLSIRINAAKEVKRFKNNKWIVEYAPAENARRGDVFLYTITYTNLGTSAANDAVIVDPIPNGTVYIPGSAAGENAQVACSIDGGQYFQPPPATYTVKNPDGTREEKPAPPEMVTHIKWTLLTPLAPNESGTLRFKVKVQ